MSTSNKNDEEQRLAAFHDLNFLDTPPERAFDRITALAKASFHVPISLVSLVDEDRQWFKSRQGLDVSETLEANRRLVLTSTQGGVTANYEYLHEASGSGTEIALNANCEAAGVWKIIHPVIVLAMRNADQTQLANLKASIGRNK